MLSLNFPEETGRLYKMSLWSRSSYKIKNRAWLGMLKRSLCRLSLLGMMQ
jgi:hypothetical protein